MIPSPYSITIIRNPRNNIGKTLSPKAKAQAQDSARGSLPPRPATAAISSPSHDMELGKGQGGAEQIPADDDDMLGSRKRGGDGSASPVAHRQRGASNQDDPTKPLTFGALQRLLASQTQLLQASQDSAIQAAVTELKMTTSKEMKTVKQQLAKHDDYIAQLRDLQEATDKRLANLEQRRDSVGSGSTEVPNPGKINLMLLGGWPDDTPRETLLAELRQALQDQGLHDEFTDIFCTGPRKGFAMGLLWTEPAESAKALKDAW